MEERRVAELRQRLDDAAAGAEQLAALVGDHDLRPLPRREMALDLVGEVMHVDHRALDAGVGQPVEHVVDQRLAADRAPAASGSWPLSGRMRVPRPAASTMARFGQCDSVDASAIDVYLPCGRLNCL